MSMSFEDAVSTLEAMFPDWDKDTLTTVLVSNNYHVERTIESIFVMQGDVASPSGPASNPQVNNATQDLLFVEEAPPARAAPKPQQQQQRQAKRRNSTPGYRGIKCDLPDSFLRPPTWEGSNHIIADEELALMLQNEMFQKEVRALMGDDFLRTREEFGSNPYFQENGNNSRYQSGNARGRQDPRFGGAQGYGSGGQRRPSEAKKEDADMGIMKALSSMGGAAKKNLSMLAERFAASGGTGGSSSGASGTSKEFKPLVDSNGNSYDDEEDGDEVINFDHNKSRNSHILQDSPKDNTEFQNPLLINNSNYRNTNNVTSGNSMKNK